MPDFCNNHGFVPPVAFNSPFKLFIGRSHGLGSFNFLLSSFSLRLSTHANLLKLVIPLYKRYVIFWLLRFIQFPDLFHKSFASLFIFPHGTCSIGVCMYLVLEVWYPFLQTSFWCSTLCSFFSYHTGLLPSLVFWFSFPGTLTSSISLATTLEISLDFFSFCY